MSICLPEQINGIISEVQLYNLFPFLVLTLRKLLEFLRGEIGTCSVFCHSFSFSNNVTCDKILRLQMQKRLPNISEKWKVKMQYVLQISNIIIMYECQLSFVIEAKKIWICHLLDLLRHHLDHRLLTHEV